MTRLSALKLSLILASSWSACALAQEAPQEPQAEDGTAIIVTGTRAVGMSAADAAAPVQVGLVFLTGGSFLFMPITLGSLSYDVAAN